MSKPLTLEAALQRIAELEQVLATAKEDGVKSLLNMLQVDGSNFNYNKPNDYGSIDITIFTGSGNPWNLYRGEEVQADYRNGRHGTGMYRLNDAMLPLIMKQIEVFESAFSAAGSGGAE